MHSHSLLSLAGGNRSRKLINDIEVIINGDCRLAIVVAFAKNLSKRQSDLSQKSKGLMECGVD